MPEKTRAIARIALMTAVTAALSFVRIPFYPVPFTLQTFAAMLAGLLLKKWEGVLSQLFYLALGLAGLPLFSQGGGVGYVFNPTFGYLLFLPALTLISAVLYGKLKVWGIIIPSVMLILFGAAYYIAVFRVPLDAAGKTFITLTLVFIPAEVLKALCAHMAAARILKRVRT